MSSLEDSGKNETSQRAPNPKTSESKPDSAKPLLDLGTPNGGEGSNEIGLKDDPGELLKGNESADEKKGDAIDVSSDSGADEEEVDTGWIESFLREWKLHRFMVAFVEHGFVSVDRVLKMKNSDLVKVGMRKGHIKKFEKARRALKKLANTIVWEMYYTPGGDGKPYPSVLVKGTK